MIALVGSSCEFQPEMEPSSLTKRNLAGCEFPFLVILNDDVGLTTVPVGFAPALFRAAVGIATVSETLLPSWW